MLSDGVSQANFLFVLAAIMYLWAPHKYGQRYAYSQQVRQEDHELKGPETSGGMWADEDSDDDESFWATTHGGTSSSLDASKIGASNNNSPIPETIGSPFEIGDDENPEQDHADGLFS